MSKWKKYRRINVAEMRPFVLGEDLTGISVSGADAEEVVTTGGGMVARNPANRADQWYVAEDYFRANFAALKEGASDE